MADPNINQVKRDDSALADGLRAGATGRLHLLLDAGKGDYPPPILSLRLVPTMAPGVAPSPMQHPPNPTSCPKLLRSCEASHLERQRGNGFWGHETGLGQGQGWGFC